jgi:CHAT domain-containing protein
MSSADANFLRPRSVFLIRGFRTVIVLAIVFTAGLGPGCSHDPRVDQGLTALRRAYQGERPFEPRTSADFDYAPLSQVRGPETSVPDQESLDNAQNLLFSVAETDSRRPYGLGLWYLTKKQPGVALTKFDQTLALSPNDAILMGDIGAAYLENAKSKNNFSLRDLALSLKYSSSALELDKGNLNALFNKALCLQQLNLSRQAAAAWNDYLKADGATPWADEARGKLEQVRQEMLPAQSPEDLMREFWQAFDAKDDERAFMLISRNREMITKKLISQQLIFAYLNAAGPDGKRYLDALRLVGKLEMKKTGDPYVSQLAGFYSTAPPEKQEALRVAYEALHNGYDLSLHANNKEALPFFQQAHDLFAQAEDEGEALLTEYWIAYCESNGDLISGSTARLAQLAELCQKKNYKWLSAQIYYSLSYNANSMNESSKAFYFADLSLAASQKTSDYYNTQKTYSSIATYQLAVRQFSEALESMEKVVPAVNAPDYSQRQKFRDLDRTGTVLHLMGFFDAAAAFENEAFSLTPELEDPSFERLALANLSRILGAQKKYDTAIEYAAKSEEAAERMPDLKAGLKGIGFAMLQTAQIELERGDYRAALEDFDQMQKIYARMEYSPYQFEAAKGKFHCYLAQKNDTAAEAAVSDLLQSFEDHREAIQEEHNLDTFFDRENDIYDLIVDYEFGRGNYRQAFDHAEGTRARSLLDWQKGGGDVVVKKGIPQAVFARKSSVPPLTLADIQPQLPTDVQMLYYTVVSDKVLLWLVTRDKVEPFFYQISQTDLGTHVSSFLAAMEKRDQAALDEHSRALYRALFEQVEPRLDSEKITVIVPDKVLCYLPFVALTSERTNTYLVADHTLLYAPSATVFLSSTEYAALRAPDPQGTEKLLSVGDPDFDEHEFPKMKPLTSAKKEATEVAKFYSGPTTLLQGEATKSNIETNMATADVVQFASHYLANERNALLSAFAVAGKGEDSRWANYEVLRADLQRPRLIILAACETGIERVYNGEGMIGAGRSFLAKGVPLVVASQWDVDSDSTTDLMVSFHRLRKKEGLTTVAALQRAQLEMLNSPKPLYRQPYYWAGFIALGGYARF